MLEGGFPNPQPVLNRLFHGPQSRDEIPARVWEPAFQHVALQFGKAEQGSSTFMSHTRRDLPYGCALRGTPFPNTSILPTSDQPPGP